MELLTIPISKENPCLKDKKSSKNFKIVLPGIRSKIYLSGEKRSKDIHAILHLMQQSSSPTSTVLPPPSSPRLKIDSDAASHDSKNATLSFDELARLAKRYEQGKQDMIPFHETLSKGFILLLPIANKNDVSSFQGTTTTIDHHNESLEVFEYGCLCRIMKLFINPDCDLVMDLEGLFRCKVSALEAKTIIGQERRKNDSGLSGPPQKTTLSYIVSQAFLLDSPIITNLADPQAKSDIANFRKLCQEFTGLLSGYLDPKIYKPMAKLIRDSQSDSDALARLVDLLAFMVETNWEENLRVLSASNLIDRLVLVNELVDRQVKLIQVTKAIETRVQKKITEKQKQAVLREKLNEIRKELDETNDGEGDGSFDHFDLDDLEKKLKQLKLSPESRKLVLRDFACLKRYSSNNSDHQVLRTYIEWVIELPWGIYTEDRLDLLSVRRILDEDHYGIDQVKRRIIEYLSVRKLKKDSKSPILCLVGPPGVGKTSLGKSIAKAINRKFYRIALGGVKDEAEIRGHRRTYVGALPGLIIQALKRCSSSNPVFLLDEIDKISSNGHRGDPSSVMLEVLDPEQNSTFTDHYLNLPFDLSQVFFIATANYIENIPIPLRDRMEIITLNSYSAKEKREIAKSYLIPKQIEASGLPPESIVFSDKVIEFIITKYTKEPGVRGLEREIGAICRFYAHSHSMVLDDNPNIQFQSISLTTNQVSDILGRPQIEEEDIEELVGTGDVGLVTGLGVSNEIGMLLFVEARSSQASSSDVLAKSNGLVLTGKLGDVIKESAQVAHSWVMCHVPTATTVFHNRNVHIHLPAGATPKDGPSAGVTIVTALVSLIMNIPVPSTIAMTGEISLRGAVLPVGGIREKVLAAYRAGVKKVLIPKKNMRDWNEADGLEDLPKDFVVVGCERIEEVLVECGLLLSSQSFREIQMAPAKL